jgi:hypothetical protein
VTLACFLQAGQDELPLVTVVLPVRGCRSHSMANWRSMLHLSYGALLVPQLQWKAVLGVLSDADSSRPQPVKLYFTLKHPRAAAGPGRAALVPTLYFGAAFPAAAGALEFVFVLEDKGDPAYAVITTLMAELKGRRPVQVQFAGFAERTSQKIHK